MKRLTSWIVRFLTFLALVFILLNYEIQALNNIYLKTFWHNLKFISAALYILIPLVLLFVLLLLLFTNKWALRVEKLSIGGFSILFDNPNSLFKRQVRNFLDTKRTIFKIDLDRDNFKETLDSFYEVYKFFRDEIKVYGDISKKRLTNDEALIYYKLANDTIKVLNNFLTEHQSNYKRWYIFLEKTDENKYYLTPIGELQKEYGNYDKLCRDFEEVNKYFINKIASKFEIDLQKWGV